MATKKTQDEPATAPEATAPTAPPALVAEAPSPPPPPPPPPPVVMTVEDWAGRKGMLPKFTAVAAPFARKGAQQRKELNPLFLSFAQAQAHFSWPIGKELTEAEFDAAVIAATTHIYR